MISTESNKILIVVGRSDSDLVVKSVESKHFITNVSLILIHINKIDFFQNDLVSETV